MNLTTQKRLAASILKVGLNRVWIDPERMEEVSMAITREGVKQLINNGAIKAKPQKGISSYRSKKLAEQKKKGKRKGRGSVKGAKKARNPKKQEWMTTIRALRKDLKKCVMQTKLMLLHTVNYIKWLRVVLSEVNLT